MNAVRMGVIGLGNIGMYHARSLADGTIEGAELTAVADTRADHVNRWIAENAPAAKAFTDAEALLASGLCEAAFIATPPPLHPPLAIRAFANGLHVLIEKPAGITAMDVRPMNEAAAQSDRVFGIQFVHRLYPAYRKARAMIEAGEIGALQRTQWTTTKWYRTQDYYDSGGWRGTWKGEGGGVLINQCPHDLDIWVWLCGLPCRVRAFCRFGRWHDLEVEDEVTAYVEYDNGASGIFICSTGEFPGTNRLEIVGDRGTLVLEDDCRLTHHRVSESVREHCRTAGGFAEPACDTMPVELPDTLADNNDNTQNFVDAVRKGTPLAAPGEEGLSSLELSNAMQLSTFTDATVNIPTDAELYRKLLDERIRTSRVRKSDTVRNLDITDSWK